jgi:predicted amidohydrolase YtcJ
MPRLTATLPLVAFALTAACGEAEPPSDPADVILYNAKVYTMDSAQPRAEAVAVRGSRLAIVGSRDEALALRGPETRVIDAANATIVPGLHDAHGHFLGLGASLQQIDLRGTKSFEEIVALVAKRAAKSRPGEWILGRSWDQNDWPNPGWPVIEPLDKVTPDNPVYLTRVDGHAALVNRRAMELAGLSVATPNPEGGRLIRDWVGRPTGVLIDNAMTLVKRHLPRPSPDALAAQAKLADATCRRLGITMVHDAGATMEEVDVFRAAIDRGELQTRLYVMLRMGYEALAPVFSRGPLIGHADHHLTVRAIKISADGALGSRGAALLEPYSDERSTAGFFTTPPAEIYRLTLAASKAGFQTCVHAIGDRANRAVMDVFERVQRELPSARLLRLRNEHAQILDAAEIPRFAPLDVIASMQPAHATSDLPWAAARLGEPRILEGAYVWRKLLDAGARIASGSDFPVEEANPLFGFYAAITRQDREGHPPEGWQPDQRMTRVEALRSFTLDAAYAAHSEKVLGSLEAGKLADLVVLSKDIMEIPPRDILDTRVLLTMIGGRVVYSERPDAGTAGTR